MNGIETFDESNFKQRCDQLAALDPDLQAVLKAFDYPPCWKRIPSFETLVHIILEQQVSLASAMAAMKKLKEKVGDITPLSLTALSNEELKGCYFSRQKISYVRQLCNAVTSNGLDIAVLPRMNDDMVRSALTKIKGIGSWTADVYLMMALQRCDLFPLGDVALVTSMKEIKQLSKDTSREALAVVASRWKPSRTIAAYILWHAYLCKRKR